MRRRIIVGLTVLFGLSLLPAGVASATPSSDRGAPPASAIPDLPDLPIQASDIALSYPNQPGTGVVLTDAAGERRITAIVGVAERARQKAEAAAIAKDYKARVAAGTFPVPTADSAPSGHRPYGGDMWSGGTTAANVASCTNGLPSRSSSGANYEYTAGHCVREDGVHDDISGTTGVFCVGWVNPCPSIDIGNTGHGGTCVGSNPNCGDRTFLRGSKIPVGNEGRAEVRVWDSRVTVAVPAVRNPVLGESASVSGGMSGALHRGTVWTTGQPTTFAAPLGVVYGAVLRSATPVGSAGCTIPGDSGGSVIAADHAVIGTLTGHGVTSDGYCWMFFGRAGDAFTAVGQVPAPQP